MIRLHAYRLLLIGLLGLIFFPHSLRSQGGLREGNGDLEANAETIGWFLSEDQVQKSGEMAILASIREHIQAIPADERKLKDIFAWLRDRYFVEYAAVASLGETLREGKFNCVSSTALCALALQQARITFRIEETPRHVLLYALQNDHWLRVETTSEERAIFRAPRSGEEWTRDISLRQLAGLQAYNAGLQALDESNSGLAFAQFSRAQELYPDARIQEMLAHSSEKEARLALRLVRKHQDVAALPHLENALQVQKDDVLLQKTLAAVLLRRIESQTGHASNLMHLEASLKKYAFLTQVKEVRQVHSDLLLAVAWENFEADEVSSGLAHLQKFEKEYASSPELVQASMAGEVYAMGWTALVRSGDEKGAEALLQRGLLFAPRSATLARKRDAMASLR